MGTKLDCSRLRLHLIDLNGQLVDAWQKAFAPFPEVGIQQRNLFSVAENCVVSPANSFGFMDGGIDAAYREFFGPQIESAVRHIITTRPEGHLPVGASLVVRTGHVRVPYLIVAPAMVTPEAVPGKNCYRAMRAVLRVAGTDAKVGRAVYCPGLATGIGRVPPDEAATLMAEAYRDWKLHIRQAYEPS
jgi:O-acetyl-ADP-ribose deacetylase (regulator of RNase III)